jgi:hypothetical protein
MSRRVRHVCSTADRAQPPSSPRPSGRRRTPHTTHLKRRIVLWVLAAFFVFRRVPVRLVVAGLMAGGVWRSGSRAALLGVGLALVIAGWRMRLAYAALAAAVGVAVSGVLHLTRFGATSQSDHARATIAAEAIRDFERSRVWGSGRASGRTPT